MKRLLVAGCGDIYQICHVVRGFERGRLHNAEFTLIEWYRLGFTLDDLMSEVDALVRALLGPVATGRSSERITYREAFLRELEIIPSRPRWTSCRPPPRNWVLKPSPRRLRRATSCSIC